MKVTLLILMFTDILLILLIFRNYWAELDNFQEIRKNVIDTLNCLIDNRKYPEKFSYLLYTLKPKLLLLMESKYYRMEDRQKIEDFYLEIEKIQLEMEKACSSEKTEIIFTTRYFETLNAIKTKFEEIARKKLIIFDILHIICLLAIIFIITILFALFYTLFAL